ncbi:MAG: acyl-CoA thioesterase [Spirochaetales bacterium]|nr:acyl-CoA thioesterase [Spirochaetales bacterium]
MDNYHLVRPEHLNHHGTLFGGQLLSWVDECAWMAAASEFPGYSFVTRAMDKIEFNHPVNNGSILRFNSTIKKVGKSSITYLVEVLEGNQKQGNETLAFSTTVTFVSVDSNGNKREIISIC